ncbi:MAG: glycosyltransferase family 4 protein [Chamaesiphon sp.]
MKILFLDQSGNLGGAELCLIDIAKPYRENCLVSLFADGPFRFLLEQQHIPVQVLTKSAIQVRKESSLVKGLSNLAYLVLPIAQIAKKARDYDIIYANTQKALVVGAVASFFSRRPLIYHLHDILSSTHFSKPNLRIAVTLANRFASLVIANSKATQTAFVEAGGRRDITEVIYNGFEPEFYHRNQSRKAEVRQKIGVYEGFLIGHFSRLSPWKGQHILIEALACCPEDVTAILVGDALFGEQEYVQQLHAQIAHLGLEERVRFLGFREDIVDLMTACDLVVHTSTAPEPFGRVIVEAMLCGRPVIAAKAGGVLELVEPGLTGWLVPPQDPHQLVEAINRCRNQPELTLSVAQQAQRQASERFYLTSINQQIAQLLYQVVNADKVNKHKV